MSDECPDIEVLKEELEVARNIAEEALKDKHEKEEEIERLERRVSELEEELDDE